MKKTTSKDLKTSVERNESLARCVPTQQPNDLESDSVIEAPNYEKGAVIRTAELFEEMSPEVKKILSKYTSEVQRTFLEMIESLDAVDELQRLCSTYDECRQIFIYTNEKQGRELIMSLLNHTFVKSYEELAMLLSANESKITSLFKGKTALRKKAGLYIRRNRQIRDKRRKFIEAEEAERAKKAAEEAEKTRKAAEEAEKAKKTAKKARKAAEKAEKERKAAEEAEKARKAAEEAEKARKEAEKARKAAKEAEKNPWLRSYYVRDNVASWISHISEATNPCEILLDTNILVDSTLREYVKNHFQRGRISMISVMELRQLTKSKNDKALEALSELMESVNDERFYEPIGDVRSDLTGDCDIKLVKLAKDERTTFVTKDMGAAVYAWVIGCPCRYLRTDPVKINMCTGNTTSKIAILDVDTKENKLNEVLHSKYSHVIITDLFAKKLNGNKRHNEFAVAALQEDICTDTNGFYEPYIMTTGARDCYWYEEEIINLCKEKNAVLVSSKPETLALAWEYGIETYYKK